MLDEGGSNFGKFFFSVVGLIWKAQSGLPDVGDIGIGIHVVRGYVLVENSTKATAFEITDHFVELIYC